MPGLSGVYGWHSVEDDVDRLVGGDFALDGIEKADEFEVAVGAVEGLDLAPLIEREHHRMARRIDIEPDDIGQLGGKAAKLC
jgi:hypothetical protein